MRTARVNANIDIPVQAVSFTLVFKRIQDYGRQIAEGYAWKMGWQIQQVIAEKITGVGQHLRNTHLSTTSGYIDHIK
ncbi:hypothetical protein GCM10023189_44830 [Nibrella saemangeumensis]|uniref:Uncharacterized protein n=1 Tax=Nibrella saemangeumensis TaxID=1084526 RepID=A0ABP8NC95_9BACT